LSRLILLPEKGNATGWGCKKKGQPHEVNIVVNNKWVIIFLSKEFCLAKESWGIHTTTFSIWRFPAMSRLPSGIESWKGRSHLLRVMRIFFLRMAHGVAPQSADDGVEHRHAL
jgi:hypothetical protein